MRGLLFFFSKLLFFVFLALSFFALQLVVVNARSGSGQLSSPTKSSESWGVAEAPARLVNGSPVLFRVAAPRTVRALSGNWLGHEIVFTFDAVRKDWFALAGVSQ
jgi:hypothetical protein